MIVITIIISIQTIQLLSIALYTLVINPALKKDSINNLQKLELSTWITNELPSSNSQVTYFANFYRHCFKK